MKAMTYEQAEKTMAEMDKHFGAKKSILPAQGGKKMTLSQARQMFIADLTGLKKAKATIEGYACDIARFGATLRSDSVLQFTPANVVGYFNQLAASGVAHATVVRKYRTLTQFAKWGTKRGLWTADPLSLMGKMSQPKTLPRPFSDDEVAALMNLELNPLEHLIRSLLFYTGLRVGPIASLKVGDVTFAPPTIRTIVKGAKTQVIQLHPRLAQELKDYILNHTDQKGYTLLLARDGRKNPRRDWVESVTHRWGDAAKVVNCTPHRFRHTFGTKLYRQTGDVRLVQVAMGHATVATTMIYTQVANEDEAKAIASLEF